MELPFMASEAIIVEMVKHGANRQVSAAACWKEAMHALNLLMPVGFSSPSSPDTRLAQDKIPSLLSLTIVSAVFSEELVTVYSRPLAVEKPVPF